MRKPDIKLGVIYAYQAWGMHPSDLKEPLVFLSPHPRIGPMWREVLLGQEPFARAELGQLRPQRGTLSNNGDIGYPAALFPEQEPAGEELSALQAITMTDFEAAPTAWDDRRGVRFLVVTDLRRVLGPWEG